MDTEEVKTPRDGHLQSAMDALDIMLLGLDVCEMEPDGITQSVLNERITVQKRFGWRSDALPPERVHFQLSKPKGALPRDLPAGHSSFDCGQHLDGQGRDHARRSTTRFETSTLIFASGLG